MTINFPKKSPSIMGVHVGARGEYQDTRLKTPMELGEEKVRVTHLKPLYEMDVTISTDDLGRLVLHDFWLNQTAQGTKWFNWDWLQYVKPSSKMRFKTPIQDKQELSNGAGLWDLSFTLLVRELPVIDSNLLDEVIEAFGSNLDFIVTMEALKGFDALEPEIETWRNIPDRKDMPELLGLPLHHAGNLNLAQELETWRNI